MFHLELIVLHILLNKSYLVFPGPSVSVDMTDISECGVFDGTITINANGLEANYEYSIDGGLTYRSTNTFTGLPAASYLVVVKGGGSRAAAGGGG